MSWVRGCFANSPFAARRYGNYTKLCRFGCGFAALCLCVFLFPVVIRKNAETLRRGRAQRIRDGKKTRSAFGRPFLGSGFAGLARLPLLERENFYFQPFSALFSSGLQSNSAPPEAKTLRSGDPASSQKDF